MDIHAVMAQLAAQRPLFHSERDFQHALAWAIQHRHQDFSVRLEPRPRRGVHLDVLVHSPEHRLAIEVKYLVAGFTGTVAGEHFELPNQAAHDTSRYDVVKDIVRLEELLTDGYADSGLAVVLTNDAAYWKPSIKADPIDAAFRIHEGRFLTGTLAWSAKAGVGTIAKRATPLALAGNYRCAWHPYTKLEADRSAAAELRYLAVRVSRTAAVPSADMSSMQLLKPTAAKPHEVRTPSAAGSTARDEILDAVAAIRRRSGSDEFELADVLAEMRRRGSQYSEATIRTHVTSRMCANAPDHHASVFNDFDRLGRGRYRVRHPQIEL